MLDSMSVADLLAEAMSTVIFLFDVPVVSFDAFVRDVDNVLNLDDLMTDHEKTFGAAR